MIENLPTTEPTGPARSYTDRAEDLATWAGAMANMLRLLLEHPADPIITDRALSLLARFEAGEPYPKG